MREVPSITLPRIHSEAIEINSHRNPPTFFSRFAPSCFQKEVSSPEIPVQGLLALNQRENLIAFSSSQCILVYNLSTLQALEISVSHESMQSGIYSMCWTKDGRSLLIGTATGICITRFTRSNSLQEFDSVMFSLCEQQGPIKVLQAAPCGRFFASSTRGASSVAVWDCLLLTGRSIECFPTKSLITFEWTPDGENLITFSRDGSITVLDCINWSCSRNFAVDHTIAKVLWSGTHTLVILPEESSSLNFYHINITEKLNISMKNALSQSVVDLNSTFSTRMLVKICAICKDINMLAIAFSEGDAAYSTRALPIVALYKYADDDFAMTFVRTFEHQRKNEAPASVDETSTEVFPVCIDFADNKCALDGSKDHMVVTRWSNETITFDEINFK